MNVDEVLSFLDARDEIFESSILVRELKFYLNMDDSFCPKIRIKIWRCNVLPDQPYEFTLSHYVHTPTQASPYRPTSTSAATEVEAIQDAISSLRLFLVGAIRAGHEPEDAWLVENEDF